MSPIEITDDVDQIILTGPELYVVCGTKVVQWRIDGGSVELPQCLAIAERLQTPDAVLEFLHGAFVYRGRECPLKGKPLAVLEALYRSRRRRATLDELRSKVWGELTAVGDEAIRSTVTRARLALRGALAAAGLDGPAEPIPVIDRGRSKTAWRLDLP